MEWATTEGNVLSEIKVGIHDVANNEGIREIGVFGSLHETSQNTENHEQSPWVAFNIFYRIYGFSSRVFVVIECIYTQLFSNSLLRISCYGRARARIRE